MTTLPKSQDVPQVLNGQFTCYRTLAVLLGKTHVFARSFSENGTNLVIPSFLLVSNVSSWQSALTLLVLLMGSDDVIAYLWWAKQNEEDAWLRDDITIAIRTVALAAQGCKDPNVVACYEVLGCHPATLQQRIEDRRRATLGSLYDSWAKASRSGFTYTDWWSGRADSLPEKKPAESVSLTRKKAA
jgi:hypothetical protein